jgi:hypothetical protein
MHEGYVLIGSVQAYGPPLHELALTSYGRSLVRSCRCDKQFT